MRTIFRLIVIQNMAGLSTKTISITIFWVCAFLGICYSDSEADPISLRRSSFSTSTDQFINPYKSRGASLRARQLSNNANQLRDAAPFPFRHLPKSLRHVPDSFFYDPQVSQRPVHLRRQRQQFQHSAHLQEPIVSTTFIKAPNDNPIVQIKELPPRNIKPQIFQNVQPFSRRAHPLIGGFQDTTVRLREISELPQTSPFPSPPPTSEPAPHLQLRIIPASKDNSLAGTATSFAKFSQSGQNLFNHRIHPTLTSSRKPKILSQENAVPSSFIPASKRPEMPTIRSRIEMSREKSLPSAKESLLQKSTSTASATEDISTELPPAVLSTTPGSAFPTIMLRTGLGVRVTEIPPNFNEDFLDPLPKSRGSTPDTIAKLRQHSRANIKLVSSFPAVPETTPPITTSRGREPRILLDSTTTSQTTTQGQKASTSFSTPTTSLFAHLRERPLSKQTVAPTIGTTRSAVTKPRPPQVKVRQSLLRAITERIR